MKPNFKRKLTLLELLIIVAIISILFSLLLPVIHSLRDKSRRVIDINNLKQIGMAINMYCQDNNGNLPYISSSISDSRCLFLLLPYLNNSLALFYPPVIYDQRIATVGYSVYMNNPKQLLNDILSGSSADIVYPGYAYTAVDEGGIPLNESRLASNAAIVTNFNGTYNDMNNILLMDGSMHKIAGAPAK